MVKANLWLDKTPAREKASVSQNLGTGSWVTGVVREVLDGGLLRVGVPADDPVSEAVVPSDGTVSAVGAVVRVMVDARGRGVHVGAPVSVPEGADLVPSGAVGRWVADGRAQVDAAMADLTEQTAVAAEAAQVAANTAEVAQNLAESKTSVTRGAGAPAAPGVGDVWLRENAAGNVEAILSWDGTVWGPLRLAAGEIVVPGTVGAVHIADGAVTAPKVVVSEELWAKIASFAKVTTEMLVAGDATITGTAVVGDLAGNTLRGGSLIAGDSSTGTARITTNASGPYIQFKNSADEETFFVDSAGNFRMIDRVRGGTVSLDNLLSSWTSTTNLADTAGGTVWTRPARTSLGPWSNFLGTQYRVMSPTGKLRVEHRLMYNESTLASDIYIQIGFYIDPPTEANITSGLYSSRAWAEFHAMTGITMPSFTASEVIVVPANTWFYVRPIWRYQAAASGKLTDVRYWTQTTPV